MKDERINTEETPESEEKRIFFRIVHEGASIFVLETEAKRSNFYENPRIFTFYPNSWWNDPAKKMLLHYATGCHTDMNLLMAGDNFPVDLPRNKNGREGLGIIWDGDLPTHRCTITAQAILDAFGNEAVKRLFLGNRKPHFFLWQSLLSKIDTPREVCLS